MEKWAIFGFSCKMGIIYNQDMVRICVRSQRNYFKDTHIVCINLIVQYWLHPILNQS